MTSKLCFKDILKGSVGSEKFASVSVFLLFPVTNETTAIDVGTVPKRHPIGICWQGKVRVSEHGFAFPRYQ